VQVVHLLLVKVLLVVKVILTARLIAIQAVVVVHLRQVLQDQQLLTVMVEQDLLALSSTQSAQLLEQDNFQAATITSQVAAVVVDFIKPMADSVVVVTEIQILQVVDLTARLTQVAAVVAVAIALIFMACQADRELLL
jgi:hypothetical protein